MKFDGGKRMYIEEYVIQLDGTEFESKEILFGKLYCEFRKRIFFDRKWF